MSIEPTTNTEGLAPTLVVGASRGLGRGIATAFAQAGHRVIAMARSGAALDDLAATSTNIRTEVADATDPDAAERLLATHRPRVVVLVAGATPPIGALHEQSWESLSVNWHTDVKLTFVWLRAVLLLPLPPGSRVIVVSSGAALRGSPLSGGYAGAKATQRFLAGYAQDEASRAGLDIGFVTVLPQITPLTGVGRPAVRAYAARGGQSEEQYVQALGTLLTPESAGAGVLELARIDLAPAVPGYLLTGDGLRELPR